MLGAAAAWSGVNSRNLHNGAWVLVLQCRQQCHVNGQRVSHAFLSCTAAGCEFILPHARPSQPYFMLEDPPPRAPWSYTPQVLRSDLLAADCSLLQVASSFSHMLNLHNLTEEVANTQTERAGRMGEVSSRKFKQGGGCIGLVSDCSSRSGSSSNRRDADRGSRMHGRGEHTAEPRTHTHWPSLREGGGLAAAAAAAAASGDADRASRTHGGGEQPLGRQAKGFQRWQQQLWACRTGRALGRVG